MTKRKLSVVRRVSNDRIDLGFKAERFSDAIRNLLIKKRKIEDEIIDKDGGPKAHLKRLSVYRSYVSRQIVLGSFFRRISKKFPIDPDLLFRYSPFVEKQNLLFDALSSFKSSAAVAEELNSAFKELGFNLSVQFLDASQSIPELSSSAKSLWSDKPEDPPPQCRISAAELSAMVDSDASRLSHELDILDTATEDFDASALRVPQPELREVAEFLNARTGPKVKWSPI